MGAPALVNSASQQLQCAEHARGAGMWQTAMQQTGCNTCFAVDAGEDGADGEVQAAKAAGDAAAAVGRRQHAAPPPPHAPCRSLRDSEPRDSKPLQSS